MEQFIINNFSKDEVLGIINMYVGFYHSLGHEEYAIIVHNLITELYESEH